MKFSTACIFACLFSNPFNYKGFMENIVTKSQEELELVDVNLVFPAKGSPFQRQEWKDSGWPLLSLSILNSRDPLAYRVFQKIIHVSHLDANLKTRKGRTPLMFAAAFAGISQNNFNVFRSLLEKKDALNLDLNAQDESGRTALMVAVENCGPIGTSSVKAVQLLLDAGADADLKTKEGQYAWDLGVRQCNQRSSLEAVEMTLAATTLSSLSFGEILSPIVESLLDKRFDDVSICTFLSLIRSHLVAQGRQIDSKFFNGWQCSLGSSVSALVRMKMLTLLDLQDDDECVICTDSFQAQHVDHIAPPSILGCGHFFHEDCLSQWFRSCPKTNLGAGEVFCPSCKTKQKIPN